MPVIFQKFIIRQDLRNNPNDIYVFGDNEARQGMGGQAGQMRGEPNAHGIATLKMPEYWTDNEYYRQCEILDKDFAPLFIAKSEGRTIVLPADGIGTGIADLERRAPETFKHLQKLWRDLSGN